MVSHSYHGWKSGRCVTWDVTVTDTLAQSYLPMTSQTTGAAAEAAADRKTAKYAPLTQSYLFVPIAVETIVATKSRKGDHLIQPLAAICLINVLLL